MALPPSGIWTAVRRWADAASHLIFPKVCFACDQADGAGDGLLCRACRGEMGRVRRALYCAGCGRSVGPFAACAPCPRCPRHSPLAAVFRVGEYVQPLSKLIVALKYGGHEEIAPALGDWAARAVRTLPLAQIDAVIPVPLHSNRRRARGFNQAERIAAAVAAKLGKPLRANLLRVRDTPPQVGVGAAQRRRNVAGAFSTAPGSDVESLRILLVDDVMTTGATACEAAGTLRRAGAAAVTLLVAAVAPPPSDRPVEEGAPADDEVTEDPL